MCVRHPLCIQNHALVRESSNARPATLHQLGYRPCPRAVAKLVKGGRRHPQTVGDLAVTKLFKERQLTTQDDIAMATYSMRSISGEQRLCSRPFWLRLYGLLSTPGEAASTNTSLCTGMISSTTGTRVPPGSSSSVVVPCGKDRYCQACEKFLCMLSQCYDACDITDTLAAFFVTHCAATWTGPSICVNEDTRGRSSAMDRMHTCGALSETPMMFTISFVGMSSGVSYRIFYLEFGQ